MIAVATMLAMAAAAPVTAPDASADRDPRAPDAVVERTVELHGQRTRVTLFDNRIAVVSRRQGDSHVLRRRLLTPAEYDTYLVTLTRESAAIDDREVVPPGPEDPTRGAVTVAVGSAFPRTLVYSALAVQPLPLARLLRLLDGLEAEVLATGPAQVELASWLPRVGDRVELAAGTRGTVIRVEPEGVLIIEHDGTHIRELVPFDARGAVIHRLLDAGARR